MEGEVSSVTRLGDFFNFGQPFKAGGNNILHKSTTLLGNFCKGVKIIHFSCVIVFGQLLKKFGNFHLVTRWSLPFFFFANSGEMD